MLFPVLLSCVPRYMLARRASSGGRGRACLFVWFRPSGVCLVCRPAPLSCCDDGGGSGEDVGGGEDGGSVIFKTYLKQDMQY